MKQEWGNLPRIIIGELKYSGFAKVPYENPILNTDKIIVGRAFNRIGLWI